MFLAGYASAAPANAWTLDLRQASGHVEFQARAMPEMRKFRGSAPPNAPPPFGGTLVGKRVDDKWLISGTATVDLTVLDTGIALRDKYMKEKYLETPKFPKAELMLSEVSFPTADVPSTDFKGVLKLHGESKEVKGRGKVETKNGVISVALEFYLNLNDYSIAQPTLMTVTVEPEISVVVFAEAKE